MDRIPLRFCPACGSEAFRPVDEKQFACGACGFVYFQNVAAAAGAVIEAKGQLLLVRRAKEPDLGMLDLPGGFVDPGETLEQALARELEEELGLRLGGEQRCDYLCSSVNEYPYQGVLYHSLDLFFLIRLVEQPEINPADDVGGYSWLDPGEIRFDEIAFRSVRDALRCYLQAGTC
jgi:NAD+ diphosphatase